MVGNHAAAQRAQRCRDVGYGWSPDQELVFANQIFPSAERPPNTLVYGTIFGWLFALFAAGGMTSPLMYGLIHDNTGSYDAALITSMAAMLTATPLLLSLGRYPAWPDPDGL